MEGPGLGMVGWTLDPQISSSQVQGCLPSAGSGWVVPQPGDGQGPRFWRGGDGGLQEGRRRKSETGAALSSRAPGFA